MSALSKIFGSHSERELKRIYPIADKVESYKEAMGKLSDEELKDKTREFKKRLEDGATLDDILPEAFATVREAAKRVLGMEHYRVQIIGGIILHQGRIAEMRTGEGKTLVSTLPAYLNALEGKGVCIVTVNDYLAKRDAEWMGQVHEFLGLKVGVVLGGMDNDERREATAAILHISQTMSLDSITCVTTWLFTRNSLFREASTMLSLMRSIQCLSMRHVHLLSFQDRVASRQDFTRHAISWLHR